jgi:outer membrane immunogenic protein
MSRGISNNFLVGLETDINGLSQSGHGSFKNATPDSFRDLTYAAVSSEKRVDSLGTLRGRVGWLATPTLLIYGTGGLAYGGVRGSTNSLPAWTGPAFSIFPATAWTSSSGSLSANQVGWTAGGGVEWMFMSNWSLKVEYLYYDLGPATWANSPNSAINPFHGTRLAATNVSTSSSRFTGNIVRAGLNYHFNWGEPAPVRANSAIPLALGLGSALAADLPSRKAPPVYGPPPSPLVWNGFYAGLNMGGGWNANNPNNEGSVYWDQSYAFGSPALTATGLVPNLFFLPNGNRTGTAGGGVGGGQAGYNFQFNPSIVVGVEADFQGSSISGNGPGNYSLYPSPFLGYANSVLVPVAAINGGNLGLDWFGTVRGRAGWLFTPSLLVYGTAGFAYGGVNAWGDNDTRAGWTAGGGLEWLFTPRWSVKIEYLYADLGNNGNNWGWGLNWNGGYHFHPEVNIVRVGVNFHFGSGAPPVFAKY